MTVARLDRAGKVRDRTRRRLAVDVLAVGYGFTTQSELPLQAGLRAVPRPPTATLAVTTDGTQRTSNPRVYAAGEATGIGGAQLAVAEGIIAGISAARAAAIARPIPACRPPADTVSGRPSGRATGCAASRPRCTRSTRFRGSGSTRCEPDTVVCRCEEVTVAEIDAAIEQRRPGRPLGRSCCPARAWDGARGANAATPPAA